MLTSVTCYCFLKDSIRYEKVNPWHRKKDNLKNGVIALVTGCHEIGFFLGPILLTGVSKIRLFFPDLSIDSHNSIGFFCAIIWAAALIITCLSRDLPHALPNRMENEPLLAGKTSTLDKSSLSGFRSIVSRPDDLAQSFVQILICIYTFFAYMVYCDVILKMLITLLNYR